MSTAPKLQQLTRSDVYYTPDRGGRDLLSNFNTHTAEHVMTVLRDDGLYRHLRFGKPGTGMYQFDLVTWPGYLAITGDIGTYTFSRLPDMFDFFTGYINHGYWAEKLKNGVGGPREEGVREHDCDAFIAWLLGDFWEYSRDLDPRTTRIWWESIRREVLDDFTDLTSKRSCLDALDLVEAPSGHYQDDWECDWTRYVVQFELCLAGIVTGIRTYRAYKETP